MESEKKYVMSEVVDIFIKFEDFELIEILSKKYPVATTYIASRKYALNECLGIVGNIPMEVIENETSFKNKKEETEEVEEKNKNNVDENNCNVDDCSVDSNAKNEDEGKEIEEIDENTDFTKIGKVKLAQILENKGVQITSRKKADLVDLCEQTFRGVSRNETETEEDENIEKEKTETEETEGLSEKEVLYLGKTAIELYKECQKRDIKVEPRNTAKFYMDLLIAYDEMKEEEAKSATSGTDTDWDEEEPTKEEETENTFKNPFPLTEDDEEEDDWEI